MTAASYESRFGICWQPDSQVSASARQAAPAEARDAEKDQPCRRRQRLVCALALCRGEAIRGSVVSRHPLRQPLAMPVTATSTATESAR